MQIHIITNETGTDSEDYEDSYLTHIGQIFFQDAVANMLLQYKPYSERAGSDIVYLADDFIYSSAGDENLLASVTPVDADHIDRGATVTNEIIVNPMTVESFRSNGAGMGPGGSGMGPVPGGRMRPGDMPVTAAG